MKRAGLWPGLAAACLLVFSAAAQAGEPLVARTAEGRFLPAAAGGWQAAGPEAFRFVLKAGLSAPAIAAELAARLAPIQVEAPDELTLVFRGPGLAEAELLARLAELPLGGDAAVGDALAALGDLGSAGAPTMGDLSSAGSIRASKAFELPGAEARRGDAARVVGEIVGLEHCQPVPLLHLKVLEVPAGGEHAAAFVRGKVVAVRGYYRVGDEKQIDTTDERTQINLRSKELKLGDRVFGKPFTRDGAEWVLETIEKL
jgi:hypothetical protein